MNNPRDLADRIGFSLDKWGGHCYQVAVALVRKGVVLGEVVTGYYDDGENVTDHCWIKLPDGTILDPTRFWLEDKEPYIFQGPADDHYDEGGVRWEAELEALRSKLWLKPPKNLAEAFRISK